MKIYEAIEKKIFWNSILRYFLQSYLKFCVIAITQIPLFEVFGCPPGKAVNSAACIVLIGIIAIYPVFTFIFLRVY